MIYRFRLSFLFFVVVLSSCRTVEKIEKINTNFDESIVIDLNNISPINNGVFEGWGTSLCWWGNRLGENESLSDKAVELFFDKEKGIGLNIVRYNIGGGDNPSHNHIKRSDSAMPGFLIFNESSEKFEYDWSSDRRQRNVLKKINYTVGKDDLIIEFFSNAPPYFMTKSGCSSGSKPAIKNNIKENMYRDFAEYLTEVVYSLQIIDGIKVSSLEPMNEPSSVSWRKFSEKQEGCHISRGKKQSELILFTRECLDKKGLDNIIVSGTDESGVGIQASSFSALSETAKASLKRINTHTYFGKNYERLFKLAAEYNKTLWVSESDFPGRVGSDNGEMGPALAFSKKIIKDMNGLKPSAWLIWQSIADYVSEEPFYGIADSKKLPDFSEGFWGLAVADFDNEEIVVSKKYYIFGQFTKFIRPNSYVIYTGSENCIASYMPEQKQVSIVFVNSTDKEKLCKFDLSSFVKNCKNITVVRTSGKSIKDDENMKTLEKSSAVIQDSVFYDVLIPDSVTTFLIDTDIF